MIRFGLYAQLILAFFAVAALALVSSAVGLLNFSKSDDDYTYSVETHGKPLADIALAIAELQQARCDLNEIVFDLEDQEKIQEITLSVQKSFDTFETLMEQYEKQIVRSDARDFYNRAMDSYQRTYKPTCQKILEDARQGESRKELLKLLSFADTKSEGIVRDIIQIMQVKCIMLDKTSQECTAKAHRTHVIVLAFSIATVVLALVLGLYIAHRFCGPLSLLTAFMYKFSNTGILTLTSTEQQKFARFSSRNDEVGQMISSCTSFIQRITAASEVLRAIAGNNLNVQLPLLSDQDTFGLSLKKMTEGLKSVIEQIEDLLSKAQAASQAKSEFMARMSHEMLTPLNGIMGLTYAVKQTNNNETVREYLDLLEESAQNLLTLITNVLEMSNMADSGLFDIESDIFSFETMFDGVHKRIRSEVQRKKQTLTHHIDPAIPQFLRGNSDRLAKVIFLLLDNAVKFTPDHGEIRFTAGIMKWEGKDITLQVDVIDNGIGMSKAQQGKIFDLFEQVDGGRTRQYQGTGLGLTLAKHAIELMGGSISVDSEPGKGSKFSFTCNVRESE